MKKFCVLAFLAVAFVASPITAATLLTNSSGQLTGATGVNVGGTLYDVTFQDGSCASLYSGCDQGSDFTFQTGSTAAAAAQALLDQVFVDGTAGNFNSDPSLTLGCDDSTLCLVDLPYGFTGSPYYPIAFEGALNFGAGSGQDFVSFLNDSPTLDTTGNNRITFAVFSPAAAVPEPATWAMMLLGFCAIGVALRHKSAAALASA